MELKELKLKSMPGEAVSVVGKTGLTPEGAKSYDSRGSNHDLRLKIRKKGPYPVGYDPFWIFGPWILIYPTFSD